MIVEKRRIGPDTLLVVEGVIKLGESAAFFSRALERVLEEEGRHVLVDMAQINQMDSTGIGELVGYLGRFPEARRRLILVAPVRARAHAFCGSSSSTPSSRSTRLWRPPSLPSRPEPTLCRLATVRRGTADESWHSGAIAVVSPGGALLHSAGDAALAGGRPLDGEAVPGAAAAARRRRGRVLPVRRRPGPALLLAQRHRRRTAARARSLLERGGFTEADLLCGAHRPLGEATAGPTSDRTRDEASPGRRCTTTAPGKHAGMLLACRRLGLRPAGYIDPQHPLQQRIAPSWARFCGLRGARDRALRHRRLQRADLRAAARARWRAAYAALADPGRRGLDAARAARASARLARAMAAPPGDGRRPGALHHRAHRRDRAAA